MNKLGVRLGLFFEKIGKDIRFALFLSLLIHLVIFIDWSSCSDSENSKQIILESDKAKFVFINFAAGSVNGDNSEPFKEKGINNEETSLLTGEEKNSSLSRMEQSASSFSDTESIVKKTYESEVLRRIHRMKYYPVYAKRMGFEGLVTLRFTLKKNGMLNSRPEIIKGCAFDVLNDAGILTITNSSPFPPFTDDMAAFKESMTFCVTIDYNLKKF